MQTTTQKDTRPPSNPLGEPRTEVIMKLIVNVYDPEQSSPIIPIQLGRVDIGVKGESGRKLSIIAWTDHIDVKKDVETYSVPIVVKNTDELLAIATQATQVQAAPGRNLARTIRDSLNSQIRQLG